MKYNNSRLNYSEELNFIGELPERLLWYHSKFGKQFEKTVKEISEENIHDLRVWDRRLAEFVKINSMLAGKKSAKILDQLKKLLSSLGSLRDNQAQQVIAIEYSLPEVFLEALRKAEKRLVEKTAKSIESFDKKSLYKRIDRLVKKNNLICSDSANLKKNLVLLIDLVNVEFENLKRKYNMINPADFSTIHAVRIAFKKFRYTAEALEKFLGFDEEKQKLLKDFQDIMGAIQDLVILTETLDKFLNSGELKLSGLEYQKIMLNKHMKIKEFYEKMPAALEMWEKLLESSFKKIRNDLAEADKKQLSPKTLSKNEIGYSEKQLRNLLKLIPDTTVLSPESDMKLYKDSQILKLLLIMKLNETDYGEASVLFERHPEYLELAGVDKLPSASTLIKRAKQMNATVFLSGFLKKHKIGEHNS